MSFQQFFVILRKYLIVKLKRRYAFWSGIDLGTTFSCVGVFQAGTGERIVFRPEENKTTIPSIIAFTPQMYSQHVRVHEISVNDREFQSARRQAEVNPHNTLYDAKRFIGKTFSEEEVVDLQVIYPFRLFRRSNGSVHFAVEHAETTPYGTPLSPEEQEEEKRNEEGKSIASSSSSSSSSSSLTYISPEEVGAIIIKRLKETAEEELSTSMQPVVVKRTVISVPADFGSSQRNATSWAAEIAGLHVVRIVSEPTAAALAYGVDKEAGTSLVMVVDLGGGTLDVSLLRKRNGMFWVLGMAGDNRLGGQDFNRRLRRHLSARLHKEHGMDLVEPGDIQRLTEECERIKIELSVKKESQISMRKLGDGENVAQLIITREEFEDVNKELFKKVLVPVDAALEMASVTRPDIDSIVLVGGSTRVPRVRELISEHFGGKELDTRVDPELAVTMGVAIQAGVISGTWPVPVSAVELPMKDGAIVKRQVSSELDDDDDDDEEDYD
eukprot:jgi/Bigna1/88781/estExt_fgenesh1_pg.C_380031